MKITVSLNKKRPSKVDVLGTGVNVQLTWKQAEELAYALLEASRDAFKAGKLTCR